MTERTWTYGPPPSMDVAGECGRLAEVALGRRVRPEDLAASLALGVYARASWMRREGSLTWGADRIAVDADAMDRVTTRDMIESGEWAAEARRRHATLPAAFASAGVVNESSPGGRAIALADPDRSVASVMATAAIYPRTTVRTGALEAGIVWTPVLVLGAAATTSWAIAVLADTAGKLVDRYLAREKKANLVMAHKATVDRLLFEHMANETKAQTRLAVPSSIDLAIAAMDRALAAKEEDISPTVFSSAGKALEKVGEGAASASWVLPVAAGAGLLIYSTMKGRV